MLRVLRQRNFAIVWLAGLISLGGDWLLLIAIPLAVYQLTGSTAATAASVAARLAPRLLLGSVAGVFVDRWDRRRTMIAANVLLGLCLLPLLAVRSADRLWLLYLVSFVQSCLSQFLVPAETALLPRLVEEADLVPANALNGLNSEFTRLVCPPLGGFVVAAWGLGGAAALDAASFFVAAALVLLVAVDARPLRDEVAGAGAAGGLGAWVAMWREWLAGLAIVRATPTLRALFLYIAIVGVGEGLFSSLFAPFVTTVLGGGGVAYGLIVAAQAVGGVVGNAAIGQAGRGIPPGRLLGLGAIGLGLIDFLTINAYRVAPGLVAPIVLMVIVGLPAAGIGVGQTTLMQAGVADAYRGRVRGSFGATMALTMLGGTGLAAALCSRLGIVPVLSLDSAAYVLGGAIVLALLAAGRAPQGRGTAVEASGN